MMPIINTTTRTLLGSMLLTLATATNSNADTITTKSSVRLDADQTSVLLRDIAIIDGEEALQYANLLIATVEGNSGGQIALDQVREALRNEGAHLGRIHVNGNTVMLRPRSTSDAELPLANEPISLSPNDAPDQQVIERPEFAPQEPTTGEPASLIIDAPTLRGEIARMYCSTAHVYPDDLRLAFRPSDEPVLARLMDEYRVEIEPQSSLQSDRVDLVIRLWQDGRVVETLSASCHPFIRTTTVRVRTDVSRDHVLREADLMTEETWSPPTQAALSAGYIEAVGKVVERKLRAGDILRSQHLRSATLIERGQQVTVRCLVGGVAISMLAEAREDGSMNDVIPLRKLGERDEFRARVVGKGEAVVDLSR